MIWTILSIISMFVFILLMLKVVQDIKLLKATFNIKMHAEKYTEDLLISEKQESELSAVYKNQVIESKDIIDQYELAFSEDNVILKCHFIETLLAQKYLEIRSYNKVKEMINIIYVSYDKDVNETALISLSKDTSIVNIYISDQILDSQKLTSFKKARFKAYHKLIRVESRSLLFLLVPFGYLMLSNLTGPELSIYMNSNTIILGISLMISVCLLNYLLMYAWMRYKENVGGKKHEQLYTHH